MYLQYCNVIKLPFVPKMSPLYARGKNINPLMLDVIDDKPEGVARGFYHI